MTQFTYHASYTNHFDVYASFFVILYGIFFNTIIFNVLYVWDK